MSTTRHFARWLAPLLLLFSLPALAADTPVLRVAYAGSMGVVMDHDLGPAVARAQHASYQGIGQGSFALARLLAGRQMQADVFVGITPGPMKVVRQTGLADSAVPVASTRMVVGYAGWGAGQLDVELAEGSWLLAPVDSDLIFQTAVDRLWETAIRRLGAEPSMLQGSSRVH